VPAASTAEQVLALPGLVAFWDFQEPAGSPRVSRGPNRIALREGGLAVERVAGGVFGPWSARFTPGAWLEVAHADAPALDLRAAVTVIAWLQREAKEQQECQAIAGKWLETGKRRQYCLFLDLRIHASAQQAAMHVSNLGGPTPGHPWCMDAAIGATPVPLQQWVEVRGSFDGQQAAVSLDGQPDPRPLFNPYRYPGPLFAGGADFTVGAVHRGGSMGNWFCGRLAGLAVLASAD